MARLEGGTGRPAGPDMARSRRDILRLGGAAALGAVGAAALRAVPASAANGDPVLAGNTVVSTSPTIVSGAAAPAKVLSAQQSDFDGTAFTGTGETFAGAIQGFGGVTLTGTLADGVEGFASGGPVLTGDHTAYGVYGLTDTGTGVTGESVTGISVYARGTGRLRQDPHALALGVPDYAPNTMEQVRDADGTLWLSNAAGNWRRASTLELFPNGRRVYGKGVAIAKGTKVLGVDATQKINAGGPTGVPIGATAAWCAVQSFEPAVLSIYPQGTADPGVGTFGVMGTAGISVQIVYMLVPLNPTNGQFSFTNMKTTARIFFDVWGYLTQAAT